MTTDLLLAVIAQAPTQAHVAYPYALAIVAKGIDVSKVNRTIIDRWSHTGLDRIKVLAWAIGESMERCARRRGKESEMTYTTEELDALWDAVKLHRDDINDMGAVVAVQKTVAGIVEGRTAALKAEVARLTRERDEAEAERDEARLRVDSLEAILISVRMQVREAETECDDLRKRIEEGDVMWELHNTLYASIEEIDIRLRDDAERVRVLAEPDPEVKP